MATNRISSGSVSLPVELNDTPTAVRILAAVPIEAEVNTWGDEIYFEIPVSVERETGSRVEIEIGEVAYWPPGQALCVFFGPTPASQGSQPRAASPVNVVGRVVGDARLYARLRDGDRVLVHRGAGTSVQHRNLLTDPGDAKAKLPSPSLSELTTDSSAIA
jgi:hypothetical protein